MNDHTTCLEWLTLIAILLGPIFAVQVQKFLEKGQEKRARRLKIFRTLMSTRATPLVQARIEALNLIDIEFQGSNEKDKQVLSQWKICLDHLNNGLSDPSAADYQNKLSIWSAKLEELNGTLLQKIGQSLGYDFDEVQIKRGAYNPKAHGDIEQENQQLRKGFIELLSEKRSLHVKIGE